MSTQQQCYQDRSIHIQNIRLPCFKTHSVHPAVNTFGFGPFDCSVLDDRNSRELLILPNFRLLNLRPPLSFVLLKKATNKGEISLLCPRNQKLWWRWFITMGNDFHIFGRNSYKKMLNTTVVDIRSNFREKRKNKKPKIFVAFHVSFPQKFLKHHDVSTKCSY